MEVEEDVRRYAVVVNHEEQYSIWLAERALPSGWAGIGMEGTKAECLAHIGAIWTDMRPLSLRRKLEAWEKERPALEPPAPAAGDGDPVNELVRRLSEPQPVDVGLRPERTVSVFRAAVERGYVHMKFLRTGTELGVRLDRAQSDFSRCDFEGGRGEAVVVGSLVLNYNRVTYRGTVDLETLSGRGSLEFVEAVAPSAGR